YREGNAQQCACQGEAAIDRREYDVERSRENDGADVIGNEAGKRGAKLCFVGENVARGVGGVARDDERPEQYEVAENDDRACEEAAPAGDLCGGALGIGWP